MFFQPWKNNWADDQIKDIESIAQKYDLVS
jgi:hypothetical protein